MAKSKKGDEFKGKIGVARFQVIGSDGDFREFKRRAKGLGVLIQQVQNRASFEWLFAHQKAGDHLAARRYMDELSEWRKLDARSESRPPKPRCEVYFTTPEIGRAIRASLQQLYPQVHGRCIDLAINRLLKSWEEKKGEQNSNFPQWMQVLADRAGLQAFNKPQPIPIDVKNTKLMPPETDDGPWRLKVRLHRIKIAGRKNAASTPDVLTLRTWTRGKENKSQVSRLWQIAAGECKFCGSLLVYRPLDNDWEVHLCFRERKFTRADVDPKRTAYLWPARGRPWFLRIDGYNHWVGGKTGKHVYHLRRQLQTQRSSRGEAYRFGSSSKKGHGRKKIEKQRQRLGLRWHDSVKSANHTTAKEVVQLLIDHRCGRLVYFQPRGARRFDRFLATAGWNHRDPTSWDWSQMGKFLHQKCQAVTIEVVIRKEKGKWDGKQPVPVK